MCVCGGGRWRHILISYKWVAACSVAICCFFLVSPLCDLFALQKNSGYLSITDSTLSFLHIVGLIFNSAVSCVQSPRPCAGDNDREDRGQDKTLCCAVREYALLSLLRSPSSPLSFLSAASVLTSTLLHVVSQGRKQHGTGATTSERCFFKKTFSGALLSKKNTVREPFVLRLSKKRILHKRRSSSNFWIVKFERLHPVSQHAQEAVCKGEKKESHTVQYYWIAVVENNELLYW